MKIFVFEGNNVLQTYYSGIAVIAADTYEEAMLIAEQSFQHGGFSKKGGWLVPSFYETTDKVVAGLKHHLWGGE